MVGLGVAVLVLLAAGVLLLSQTGLARGPFRKLVSQAIGRPVAVERVQLYLLTGAPETVFDGLRIAQPTWAGPGDFLTVRSGIIRTTWGSLLQGHPVISLVELDQPVLNLRRSNGGTNNWTFQTKSPRTLERLVIRQGRLTALDDGLKLHLTGTVATGAPQKGTVADRLLVDTSGQFGRRPVRLGLVEPRSLQRRSRGPTRSN